MSFTDEQLRDASPSIFDAQDKPSTKAIKAMEEWKKHEADTDAYKEWCDAAIEAMKQARKGGWE